MSEYYRADLAIIVAKNGKLTSKQLAKLMKQAAKERIDDITPENVMDIVSLRRGDY